MNTTAAHYGRRIAFLRGLFRMTQTQLAEKAGFKQQDISDFEGKAELSDEVLLRLLEPLGVTLQKFKEMDESVFGATIFHVQDQAHGNGNFNTNNFNPVDKILELVEENKKLYERLLEAEKALLAAEKEKTAFLQQMVQTLQSLLDKTKE